jgi:hypothetical protein
MGRYALVTPRRFDPNSPRTFVVPQSVLSQAKVVRLASPYTRPLTGQTFTHLLLTEIGCRYVVGVPFNPPSREAAFCNGLVQVVFGEFEILIEGRFDQ